MDYNMKEEGLSENNFYRNIDGTSAWETFSLIFPTFLLIFIATLISSIFMENSFNLTCYHFIVDFVIIIIPIILSITILDKYTVHYTLFLCIIVAQIIFFYFYSKKSQHNYKIHSKPKTNFVTNIRATITILTCVAILAVDFKIFSRRHAKTETFGYSLMDVGVGLFVFSNGIVSPEVRNKPQTLFKSFISTTPLWILGIGRFFATQETDYYVPVSEYGVHWNFFITLGVTRVISSVILKFISIKKSLIISIIVLILHECLIQGGLEKWVMGISPRNNFIEANREGISASLGYVGLYFLSVHIGKIILTPKTSKNVLSKLFFSSCAFLIIHLILSGYFGVSRRLANTAYCTWVMFIAVCMSFLFMSAENISEYLYEMSGQKNKIYIPLISNAVNYNGLVYFLLCNVITGLINLSIKTRDVNLINSIVILILYKFITCFIVTYLYTKKIKLKIW